MKGGKQWKKISQLNLVSKIRVKGERSLAVTFPPQTTGSVCDRRVGGEHVLCGLDEVNPSRAQTSDLLTFIEQNISAITTVGRSGSNTSMSTFDQVFNIQFLKNGVCFATFGK